MSDLRNLFISTEKGLFFGRAEFHKDLAKMCDIPEYLISFGGGVFDQRSDPNKWILFGESFDFGKFDPDMINFFINVGEVYWLSEHRKLDKRFAIDTERKEAESDKF